MKFGRTTRRTRCANTYRRERKRCVAIAANMGRLLVRVVPKLSRTNVAPELPSRDFLESRCQTAAR
jgi:hypothetical protein